MTKNVIFDLFSKNSILKFTIEINELINKTVFGIRFAVNYIDDKAKPRAIVGRKATGPPGIAGLPKQKEFCGPVVYVDTGPSF
jgi:hypothetical protein